MKKSAKITISAFLLLFSLNLANVQGVLAKKNTKPENIESVEIKPDSKLSSSSAIWVDPITTQAEVVSPENDQTVEESSLESSKPSLIIYLIAISLTLFVGIMVFSIFNTNSKKKSISAIKEINSNFKLLDSLNLDGNRNLYLVQLFDRRFLIASTLTSISLISEVARDSIEAQIAETIATVQKPENNLDFMTMSHEDEINSGFDALLRNENEIQTSRNLRNKNSNLLNKKASAEVEPEVSPKLPPVPSNAPLLIEEESKKSVPAASTISKSKLANDYIQSMRSNEIIPPASRIMKKPSWLQEREARIKQIEAKLAAREKSSSEKSILKTQQTLKNTFASHERNKEAQIVETSIPVREEKLVTNSELATSISAIKNSVEEISQVQKQAVHTASVVKTRKISIVED